MNQPRHAIVASGNTKLAAAYLDHLATQGYSIRHETDAQLALQAALVDQPTLVILDLALGHTCHDLIDILSQTPETEHTVIIALAPLVDDVARQRIRQLGARDLMVDSLSAVPAVVTRALQHTRIA